MGWYVVQARVSTPLNFLRRDRPTLAPRLLLLKRHEEVDHHTSEAVSRGRRIIQKFVGALVGTLRRVVQDPSAQARVCSSHHRRCFHSAARERHPLRAFRKSSARRSPPPLKRWPMRTNRWRRLRSSSRDRRRTR